MRKIVVLEQLAGDYIWAASRRSSLPAVCHSPDPPRHASELHACNFHETGSTTQHVGEARLQVTRSWICGAAGRTSPPTAVTERTGRGRGQERGVERRFMTVAE